MEPGHSVLSRRRCLVAALSAAAAVSCASPGLALAAGAYSKRAVALVERSLIIDMLGPLKLDLRPEAFSEPLTEAEVTMFRSSGITAFHNSTGIGGATAYDDALEFIAAWSGFAGGNR